MLKMSSQVETIVSAYRTLSKIPSVVGGKLNKGSNRVTSRWSVRNLDKGKSTKYAYNYVLNEQLNVVSKSDFGIDVSTELLSAVSPKETFRAVIREEKDSKDVKKQYLEVWRSNQLAHSVDLTALELHGDVYADSEFGSLDWSQDETALVYIAEKKLKKSEPYIKRKAPENPAKSDGSGDKTGTKGEEFLYRQDWGEQLVGKHMSVIVVCRLPSETFTVLEGLRESWCPGQVRFTPDGDSVVGVAWETEPRRLGLIFCTNRPSCIFKLSLDGNLSIISSTSGSIAVRSPRITPDGAVLWLQRSAGGPHHACHALMAKKLDSDKIWSVIDIVETSVSIKNGDSFFGVYSQGLPARCSSSDGKRVIFSTAQQTEVRAYVVDVESGKMTDISIRENPGSTSVLDVNGDVILASYSNMTTPSQLYVARLPPPGREDQIQWIRISQPIELPKTVSNSKVEYLNLEHEGSKDTVKSFTALYFSPAGTEQRPLIVWPHGGPHSGFVNAYALETAFFNMLGFSIINVNYRGSAGSGDATIKYLPKRAGDADVKDCKLATDVAVKKYPIDETKVCLFGGSHGGFLVAHLSGQYPDTYKIVVTRNPVIDVASMLSSTDIADWCAVEAGYEFTEAGPVSEEHLLTMRRCSPLVHVHRVRAPTAVMLGAGDKRVPMFQGMDYSRRLKANGVPTRVYVYEDNHSLSSPAAEMDNLINSASWFFEHLS